MKTGQLTTNGDPVAATTALLRGLVEKSIVDEVLAPAATPSGSCSLVVFADTDEMSAILPWAPVMPVQAARALAKLAFTDPGAKIAAVVRPCEARAAVELIKLKQIQPENLLFVTVDCPGTCESAAFSTAGLDAVGEANRLATEAGQGKASAPDAAPFRTSCTVCENPAAEWGGLKVQLFGANPAQAVGLEADDEIADSLVAAELATFGGETLDGREAVVSALKAERAKARDELFAAFDTENNGLDGLKKAFSTCIRCYNCMENCPICYCKVCIFKTPTFDHAGDKYAGWAKRKGAQKMPSETVLFHLTRLNHMSTSCIGCGLCDTVCPMGLPVTTLFRKTAQGTQEMMDYVPGRSLDDPIPLSVFREDELQDESGAKD
jgi:formate dehydrogenase subunit beta